jgi:hypothetical protein
MFGIVAIMPSPGLLDCGVVAIFCLSGWLWFRGLHYWWDTEYVALSLAGTEPYFLGRQHSFLYNYTYMGLACACRRGNSSSGLSTNIPIQLHLYIRVRDSHNIHWSHQMMESVSYIIFLVCLLTNLLLRQQSFPYN